MRQPLFEREPRGINRKAGHIGLLFQFRLLTAENSGLAPGMTSSEGMLLFDISVYLLQIILSINVLGYSLIYPSKLRIPPCAGKDSSKLVDIRMWQLDEGNVRFNSGRRFIT